MKSYTKHTLTAVRSHRGPQCCITGAKLAVVVIRNEHFYNARTAERITRLKVESERGFNNSNNNKGYFLKHLLKVNYFLQTSTNVQAILVLMAALVKTRLADTFVSVLLDTREKIVKPVSNYIRTRIQKKPYRPLYMEGR